MSKSFRNIRMQEAKDPGEYDQEGDMSMTQLRSIIYHAQELHDQLDKNDNLPEWVQSKITLAQDYVQTACDYMYSQKNEEVVQEKRGLWDNIHAKRQRIKNGSGESMRKPGSEGAPSAEDLKNSQVKEEGVAEEVEQMDEAPLRAVSALVGYPKLDKKVAAKGTPGSEDERNKAAAGLRKDRSGLGRRAYTGDQHYDVRREEVEQIDEAIDARYPQAAPKEHSRRLTDQQYANKLHKQHATAYDKLHVTFNRRKDIFSVRGNKDGETHHITYRVNPNTNGLQMTGRRYGVKEEVEQIEEGRPSQQHPIEGHEYHKKSDAELRYILKDAGTAAKAMKDHSPRAESKYLDQVNDASTVLSFRQRNGTPAWYKKKYDHVNESVDTPPFTPDAPKKNSGVVVGKRPEGMSKARHLARLAMKGELNKKKTVKEDSSNDVEKTNTPAKRTVSKTTMIVKDAAKSSKDKKNKDKFEPEPELSSQIVRNNF